MASVRQKKYVQFLATGMNQTDAIIKAGYSVKNRKQASSRAVVINKSKKVQELMLKSGLSDERATKALADALTAEKPITDKTGEVVNTWPDHLIRLKSAELYFKLMGLLGGKPDDDRQRLPPTIKVQFVKIDSRGNEKVIKTIQANK